MRNTILLVSRFREQLTEVLEADYDLILASDASEALEILEEQYESINIILIDAKICHEDSCAFLDAVSGEVRFSFIAVMTIIPALPTDLDAETLEHGASDLISLDAPSSIIRNRISNAIRLKDSKTFVELESILRELPSLIFLKDSEGKYVFSTHYWHHLDRGDDPNWTIRGKTDVDIRKDRENALEAMKIDEKILASGVGAHYTIKIDMNDKLEFLDITKQPIRNARGDITGIIALINDVTEQELLKLELQRTSTIDGLTELYNRITIQNFIGDMLDDTTNNVFSLIMLDIDDFKIINDSYGHLTGDVVLQRLSDMIREICAESVDGSVGGRWGGEEFMILLPGADELSATAAAERLRTRFMEADIEGIARHTISLGITQVRDNDDLDSLYLRVDEALYAAKGAGGNQIRVL